MSLRIICFFVETPYAKHTNLDLVRFPPNSGDLNPIETVWARLRRELAVREIAEI